MRFTGPRHVKYCADCSEFERDLEKTHCKKCGKSERFFRVFQSRKSSEDMDSVGNYRNGRIDAISLSKKKILERFGNNKNWPDIEKNLQKFQDEIDGILMNIEVEAKKIWTTSHLLPIKNFVENTELLDKFDKELVELFNETKTEFGIQKINKSKKPSILSRIIKMVEIIAVSKMLFTTEDWKNIIFLFDDSCLFDEKFKKEKFFQLKKEWDETFTKEITDVSDSILFTEKMKFKDHPNVSIYNENNLGHIVNLGGRFEAFYARENKEGEWWDCQAIEDGLKKLKNKHH